MDDSPLALDRTLRDRWQPAEDAFTCPMPAGWAQGRSVFGGLTAAMVAALGRRHVGDERILRSQSVSLLQPVLPGPVSGSVCTLREGKGVRFVEVRLHQRPEPDAEERLVATAQLTFIRPRANSVRVEAPARWEGPDPDSLAPVPYIPGVMPEFLQHVDMRWAAGSPPYSGAEEAHFLGYCRFRGPSGDAEGLIALLDAWPSPTLSRLTGPAPASTVTWNAHLLAIPDTFEGWFAFEYRTVVGADGFHTAVGQLHAPDGRLVGWTEQLMAVFD